VADRDRDRRPTSTSDFGASRRESHDATDFYARFAAPDLSSDTIVNRPSLVDEIVVGDAAHMDKIDPASVALVVTSPPYFAGKQYEQALGEGHIPATYLEYLEMLERVFAECVEKLEPGGRIAVNVANLGRKPYRSLAADVTTILQDRLRLLLRGEIVWWKARGAGGSCAWGSFQSPANPVLRDLTERVIIASKGRFDRALTARQRAAKGMPSRATVTKDEFMEATLDVWEIPSESATRVGHPAPFPVELPQRLIELYTYRGDLVLDPFMGSGTTAIAAVRTGRRYIGYDTDETYVEKARARIAAARTDVAAPGIEGIALDRVDVDSDADAPAAVDAFTAAVRSGERTPTVARALLELCGFVDVEADRKVAPGLTVTLAARDAESGRWFFDLSGSLSTTHNGLRRAESLWRALGRAAVLHQAEPDVPLVLLTTDLPAAGTPSDASLRSLRPTVVHDIVELLDPAGRERLERYARGNR
jgi:DNA modification methylase